MMKRILIPVLILNSFTAKSHQDTVTVDLGEAVIRERRIEIPFSKVSGNINFINRKDIETTSKSSLWLSVILKTRIPPIQKQMKDKANLN